MVDDVITEQVVSFVLDGREVQGRLGETIIQVADREGVYIPRFCYHERLSIAANCRMCLVQVNQGDKTLPACHAQIAEGMEVQTQSKATKHSQKSIMEFLLINHPLDAQFVIGVVNANCKTWQWALVEVFRVMQKISARSRMRIWVVWLQQI